MQKSCISMARLREIKKYGDSWIIKLNPIDAKDFDLKEGEEIDIEDMIVKRKRKQ